MASMNGSQASEAHGWKGFEDLTIQARELASTTGKKSARQLKTARKSTGITFLMGKETRFVVMFFRIGLAEGLKVLEMPVWA